jgi:hypothetical protein
MHNESTCSASLSQCGPRSSLVALRCSAPINDCFAGNPRRVPSLKMRTLEPKVFAQLLRASADPAGAATPGGVSPCLPLECFRVARNSARGRRLSCEHGLLQGATDVAMVEPAARDRQSMAGAQGCSPGGGARLILDLLARPADRHRQPTENNQQEENHGTPRHPYRHSERSARRAPA